MNGRCVTFSRTIRALLSRSDGSTRRSGRRSSGMRFWMSLSASCNDGKCASIVEVQEVESLPERQPKDYTIEHGSLVDPLRRKCLSYTSHECYGRLDQKVCCGTKAMSAGGRRRLIPFQGTRSSLGRQHLPVEVGNMLSDLMKKLRVRIRNSYRKCDQQCCVTYVAVRLT